MYEHRNRSRQRLQPAFTGRAALCPSLEAVSIHPSVVFRLSGRSPSRQPDRMDAEKSGKPGNAGEDLDNAENHLPAT